MKIILTVLMALFLISNIVAQTYVVPTIAPSPQKTDTHFKMKVETWNNTTSNYRIIQTNEVARDIASDNKNEEEKPNEYDLERNPSSIKKTDKIKNIKELPYWQYKEDFSKK